jgi:hypothetical protein
MPKSVPLASGSHLVEALAPSACWLDWLHPTQLVVPWLLYAWPPYDLDDMLIHRWNGTYRLHLWSLDICEYCLTLPFVFLRDRLYIVRLRSTLTETLESRSVA